MSAAFAPGPWTWHKCFDRTGKRLTSLDIVPADGHSLSGVAVLASVFGDEANVRLIVAAPELYALAVIAVEHMEQSLALILESHCLLDDKLQPIRDTLEEDARDEVERLEKDIAAARALLVRAGGEQ